MGYETWAVVRKSATIYKFKQQCNYEQMERIVLF